MPAGAGMERKHAVIDDRRPHFLGPGGHVGLHEEFAIVAENPRDIVEEFGVEDAALVVSLLPPWIGEMEKYAGDAALWTTAGEQLAGVSRPHDDARETFSPAPFGDPVGPFVSHLEGQQADRGRSAHSCKYRATAPNSDVDLDFAVYRFPRGRSRSPWQGRLEIDRPLRWAGRDVAV